MFCFKCDSNHADLNTLIDHYQNTHLLNRNSTYRCNQSSCKQSFSNLKTFKKHALNKHAGQAVLENNTNNYNSPNLNKIQNNQVQQNNKNIVSTINDEFQPSEKNPPPKFDFEKSFNDIVKCAAKFTLSLHNNNSFSRSNVYEIIKNTEQYIITPIISTLKSFINSKFQQEILIYNEILHILTNFEGILQQCSTDHKLHKWLKESDLIQEIKEFSIDSQIDKVFHNGYLTYDEKNVTGILLPLKFQFQKFFENNLILDETLKFMNELEKTDRFNNFIQGALWKKKKKMYPGKILIPYFLYFDDLQINNALGTHATGNSICNVYYSFPSLPWNESKLKNVFLAAIVKSKDIKQFKNAKCFEVLVNDLISLEMDGIDLKSKGSVRTRVHFVLGLVLGDNLGLNSILDFQKSFSSNSYCRFCKLFKAECKTLCTENQAAMRNTINYDDDLKQQVPNLTGITQNCIFNKIPSFHVVDNFSVDIMHDVFEGVCHYDLAKIINYFVNKMKYFTLETLNSRKQHFEYGPIEIGNISGEIQKSHLINNHFKMSASEMMCFIAYFPLMIGDLVPSDDEVWEFLINLVEIIDLLLSFEISETYIEHLRYKITSHNQNYIRLFNDKLKPKFHNLVHYPTILQQSGPLRKIWCFKFEAKHKQFKLYASAITSRKIICLTLARKYELKFANQIINFENGVWKDLEISMHNKISINYNTLIYEKLKINEQLLMCFDKIRFNGTEYRIGFYVATFTDDLELYEIITIISRKDNENYVRLMCQKLNEVQFKPQFLSFEVDPKNLGNFAFLEMNDLVGPPVTLIKTARGKTMLRVKEHCFIHI